MLRVDRFNTTRWTLIMAARRNDAGAREALSDLCRAYWQPVYAYVRRHGHSPEVTADLTQSFFLHLLEHRSFERADPARGRFRSFLLASARNFLVNARDRELTLRRGGDKPHEPIDYEKAERSLGFAVSDPESSPDAVFERQWALQLMARAIERVGREYAARGQQTQFDRLRPFLTFDGDTGDVSAPDERSNAAMRQALHRLRKRFGEALRAEIADTVGNDTDVDEELTHLLHVVSR
jgi:RNA polymerase sigma-70 factor (ECF subfamily)